MININHDMHTLIQFKARTLQNDKFDCIGRLYLYYILHTIHIIYIYALHIFIIYSLRTNSGINEVIEV